MPKFANFVQCTLVAGITAGATTIQVEAQSPYNLPPDPAGQTAYITLMDSLSTPTKFEIVAYTGITSIDATSLELTGCTRAQQGTTASAWSAGDFARLDLTGESLGIISLTGRFTYAGSVDATVRKISDSGLLVWTNGDSDADVLSVDADSFGVYAGDINGGIRRITHSGALVWEIEDPAAHDFPVVKIWGDGTGNIYSLGVDNSGSIDASLKKHDVDGNELWEYSPSTWDAVSFAVGADGFIYVVTQDELLKIDPAEGVLVRSASKSGGGASISATPDGFIWAFIDNRLRKYDLGLNEVLVLDGTGGKVDGLGGIAVGLKDGSAIMIGEIVDGGTTYGAAKVDALGEPVWLVDLPNTLTPIDQSIIDGLQAHPNGDVSVTDGFDNKVYLLSGVDGSLISESGDSSAFQGTTKGVAAWPSISSTSIVYNDGFELARPFYSDLAGVPTSHLEVTLSEASAPEDPPSGKCYVYVDSADGSLKVKFSNGTVKTIATSTP